MELKEIFLRLAKVGAPSGLRARTAQTRAGIPSSTIGLPRRYSHSPVEAFDLKDLEGIVKILVAAIKRLDAGLNLHRA